MAGTDDEESLLPPSKLQILSSESEQDEDIRSNACSCTYRARKPPTFKYNHDDGLLKTFFTYSNTIFASVFGRPGFWLFIFLHLSVFAWYNLHHMHSRDDVSYFLHIDYTNVKILTAMTIFFQVFYTNHCYRRYQRLYQATRAIFVQLYNFTYELRVNYKYPEFRPHARLASRYLMASLVIFFDESVGSEGNWQELLDIGLLNSQEKKYLLQFSTKETHLILLHWCGEVTRIGHRDSKCLPNILKALVEKLLLVNALQQYVLDTIMLPVPFQYFHLLSMMCAVNLFFWAYAMGLSSSIFSPLTYFFVVVIFMGMMELASQLADPFGDDAVDFPVNNWTADLLQTAILLIEYDYPEAKDDWKKALEAENKLEVNSIAMKFHLG